MSEGHKKKGQLANNLAGTLVTWWAVTERWTVGSRAGRGAPGRHVLFFRGLCGLRGLSVGVRVRIHGLCKA